METKKYLFFISEAGSAKHVYAKEPEGIFWLFCSGLLLARVESPGPFVSSVSTEACHTYIISKDAVFN